MTEIFGYYTCNSCVQGWPPINPHTKTPPALAGGIFGVGINSSAVAKQVVEDNAGNIQIISPPLNPYQIEPVNALTSCANSDLECLLRGDGTSVPTLEWDQYFYIDEKAVENPQDIQRFGSEYTGIYRPDGSFFGYYQWSSAPTPYNTSSQIVDQAGQVIGHLNVFELYNQAGVVIAQIAGKNIVRNGEIIGRLNYNNIYNTKGEKLGHEARGGGKVFFNHQIVASVNEPDNQVRSLANLFFFEDAYISWTPDLSAANIANLENIANNFRPTTETGKALRKKVLQRLKVIKDLKRQADKAPDNILLGNSSPLGKIVAIYSLAEKSGLSDDKFNLLIAATKDPDRFVRYAAVTALGELRCRPDNILPALADQDTGVRLAALGGLDKLLKNGIEDGQKQLILSDVFKSIFLEGAYYYLNAALVFLKNHDKALAEKLIAVATNPRASEDARKNAIEALTTIEAKEIKALLPALSAFPVEIRAELAEAFCRILPEELKTFGPQFMADQANVVRKRFADSLYHANSPLAGKFALQILIDDDNPEIRAEAINILRNIGDIKHLGFIKDLLDDLHSRFSFSFTKKKKVARLGPAIEILGGIGGDEALALIKRALDLPYEEIQTAAIKALNNTSFMGSPKAFLILINYLKKPLNQRLGDLALQVIEQNNDNPYNVAPLKGSVSDYQELLKSDLPGARYFAARGLIQFGINIFPLLDKLSPKFLDQSFLNMIGSEIGAAKDEVLFNVLYQRYFSSKADADLKRNTYLLLGLVAIWKEKLAAFGDVEQIYFNKLEDPSANPTIKRLSLGALVELMKLRQNPVQTDKLAKKLLALGGPLETFTLRNLAAVRNLCSPRVKQAIEDKVNALLIAKAPPYDEWFNKAKNPEKIITAKVYFQLDIDTWQAQLLEDGFCFSDKRGECLTEAPPDGQQIEMVKVVNGVTLKVILVDISGEQGKLRTNIFQDLADPTIQYLAYNGHSGMGGNMEELLQGRQAADPSAYGTKIAQIASCSSMQSYYARLLKVFPNSQFIGNITTAFSPDDVKVFIAALNGIAFKKSWAEIDEDIKGRGPFRYHQEKKLPEDKFNHMLPNNIDQFKYAIISELDSAGIDSLSFTTPQQELSDINAQYGGRLRQAVNNVNAALVWQPFFENAEILTGNGVSDGVYFLSPTDNQTPINIWQTNNDGRPMYQLEVNAGYAHFSIDALSVLLLYEINAYFSLTKNPELTKEDKLRGLLMAAEYIHYHYQGREVEGEQLFALFKQKYGFAQTITHAEVYLLQKAIDDKSDKVPVLQVILLKKID